MLETRFDARGWPETPASNPGPAGASSSCESEDAVAAPTATLEPPVSTKRRARTDDDLARAAGRGDAAAFEALYERYHLALLSFSRHMLGRAHDAEDVVQHTFLAADSSFRAGKLPKSVRAWLYTVARNRCISVLRARREDDELPDAGVASTENLAAEVELREDLRELLADLRALPDDQRAALLLAELGDLSHAEVAAVIGVRTGKVKALVFQARRTLMATADARAIPCHSIRAELSVTTGSALRRRHLRDHVARCEGCREFADRVRAQRASVAVILPVIPTVALRESVLGGLGAGGAAAGGAGASAGIGMLAAKSTAAKLLAVAALGGAAAGGGTAAVTALDEPGRTRSADRPARTASGAAAPAAVPGRANGAPAAPVAGERLGARMRADAAPGRRDRRDARRTGKTPDTQGAIAQPATPPTASPSGNAPSKAKPTSPRGRALGHAKTKSRAKTPPGRTGARPTPAAHARKPDGAPPAARGNRKPRATQPPRSDRPKPAPPPKAKPAPAAPAPPTPKAARPDKAGAKAADDPGATSPADGG